MLQRLILKLVVVNGALRVNIKDINFVVMGGLRVNTEVSIYDWCFMA